MDPLVSLIIPVYNAEKTLHRCVMSLLKQSYTKLEIICVDDASTDKSASVLSRFASQDKRIKSIRLDVNKGTDHARFVGIENASGEYIAFVDADDWLPQDSIEKMLSLSLKTDSDIVEGSITRVLGRKGLIRHCYHKETKTIVNPELFDDYFKSFFGINILNVSVWGKLYKRELFENQRIQPTYFRLGEDLLLSMKLFLEAGSYTISGDNVYYYRYGGMTSGYNPNLYPDLKEQYFIKIETIKEYGYNKAIPFTRIEMCNVLRTQVQQMLLYGKTSQEIADFLQAEIQSGFVNEITKNIPRYPAYYPFLNDKDIASFIQSERKGLWKKKCTRIIKNVLSKIA